MQEIKIKDILRECSAELICGDEEIVCIGFSKDTRTLEKGDIYLGIKGEKIDGNLLYKEAFDKGAGAVILDDISCLDKDFNMAGKTIVKVKDTVKALQMLAKYKRSLYDIPVIAVTGSVGKTSTKDIIASVVSKKYKVLKTEGNFNNELGMPLTIMKLKDEQAMVLEMGTDKFGDLSLLTDIAKPTICVFTIIGSSHIANFGSRENILKGKMEILEGLSQNGSIVINNDNDLLNLWNKDNSEMCSSKGYNISTYGIDNKSDYVAENIRLDEFGTNYSIKINDTNYNIDIPVGGKHFVYNSLAAIAVGNALGIQMGDIIEGIKEFKLTRMRMDITNFTNNIIVINDTYNASLDSMKSGLEYVSKITNHKKIAILGDMLELGNFSESMHREVGNLVYKNNVEKLIAIGLNAKFIAEGAINAGMDVSNVKYYPNNMEAIKDIDLYIEPNSVIFIKASRGMHLEEIYNAISNSLVKGDN